MAVVKKFDRTKVTLPPMELNKRYNITLTAYTDETQATARDLTGYTFTLVAKENAADSSYLINKSCSHSGAGGVITIDLDPSETNLSVTALLFDLKAVKNSKLEPFIRGEIPVLGAV
ncbi:MAG: hypothetical protein EBR82_10200 [Caulobacteraceae bacterium]|nr:hypothetical protein [Caulobacteraceae bacterium]